MATELWTPQGSTYVGEDSAGFSGETGASIVIHTFKFHDKETGKTAVIKVPADPDVSQSHIEDMAAQSLETWLTEVREKGKSKTPTVEERKELGRIVRDFKNHARKRNQSSNGVMYYKGTKR